MLILANSLHGANEMHGTSRGPKKGGNRRRKKRKRKKARKTKKEKREDN
jgi:hypothetical protein